MTEDIHRHRKLLFVFAVMVFLLNFFWESWHAVYLYAEGEGSYLSAIASSRELIWLLSYASLVDAMLVMVILLIGMKIWKDRMWFMSMNRGKWGYLILVAVVVAILIEIKAVYWLNQWQYSELMPTIFGLGVSPLVQLATTSLLALTLVRWAGGRGA